MFDEVRIEQLHAVRCNFEAGFLSKLPDSPCTWWFVVFEIARWNALGPDAGRLRALDEEELVPFGHQDSSTGIGIA